MGFDDYVRHLGVRMENAALDPAKPDTCCRRGSPALWTRRLRWIAALTGLLFTAWVLVAADLGPQGSENPLRGAFYVLLWVGLVAVSVAIGPIWRSSHRCGPYID